MNKLVALALALLMVLVSTCIAEEIPFSEWIAGQDHVVTDVFPEETPVPGAPATEALAFEPIGVGSRGETVAQLQAKLIELGILDSKADGVFGPSTESAVKVIQSYLGWEETGIIDTIGKFEIVSSLTEGDGINLATNTSAEWSEWIYPEYGAENKTYYVANAYLGEKRSGDVFTCQIEIEFSNVSAIEGYDFGFWTQGKVDGRWGQPNIWDWSFVHLDSTPSNGVYKYVAVRQITEENTDSVQFELGFRCDYWADGCFRVRNIKVEKGGRPTSWTQNPQEIGDGINLAVHTSENWSEWIQPEYNIQNSCVDITDAVLNGEKSVGDLYSCQIEVEFSGVSATQNSEGTSKFRFFAQGKVDDSWDFKNIWNTLLVDYGVPPQDGVYQFASTYQITEDNADAIKFSLSFRCDNWASGSFRVRCVKVEKGAIATEWSPSVIN